MTVTAALLTEAVAPGEEPRAAEALLLLGRTRIDLGDYDAAAEALDRALALTELLDGEEAHALRLVALGDRAALERVLGRYEEAERRYRHALALAQPDSLDEAALCNDLAVTLKFEGRLGEAERLDQRPLAISERALGPEHPDLATLFHNLGGLAHARGDYAAAALAAVLDALGRDGEAEALLRGAIDVFERTLGGEHYEVAFNLGQLGALLFRLRRLDEAEALCRSGLEKLERLLGADHPDLAPPLNNLAVLLAERDRSGEAAALHRRALAILEHCVEADHPTLLACRDNLAALGAR